MNRFDSIIDALLLALQQELDLLDALSVDEYRASAKGYYQSSVGKHLRHNLDHFTAFFEGLALGRIDYECRERNTELERSPDLARAELERYMQLLEGLKPHAELALAVREESEGTAAEVHWLPSSCGRELQFLLGHTVHHNALVAQIVHASGIALPQGFGVAPSTQRHQQRLAAVAE